MQAHIDAHQFAEIIFPRFHGKTSQILGRILFTLGNNRNAKIKIISSSDGVARKRVKAIRDHLTKNKKLRRVFPGLVPDETADTWSKSALTVRRDIQDHDPSVEGVGILSTGMGGRATHIFFDDIHSYRNTIKVPALRPAIKDAFDEVWMNLLGPDGRAVYIGTPLHADDLTHQLKKNELWSVLEFAVGENYEPVWREKWPSEKLKEREVLIGKRAYDRNFRNIAFTESETMFPESIIRKIKEKDIEPTNKMFDKMEKFVGVDLALSETGAYTVLFEIGVEANIKYPLKIYRGRWSSPQTANMIKTVFAIDKPIFCVENNGYQQSLIQWMEALGMNIPVLTYTTGLNKADISLGLPSIAIEMDKGMWKVPMGGREHPANCACPICNWLSELASYPIGKYDDTVMAMLFAREAYRQTTESMFAGFDTVEVY